MLGTPAIGPCTGVFRLKDTVVTSYETFVNVAPRRPLELVGSKHHMVLLLRALEVRALNLHHRSSKTHDYRNYNL